MLYACMWFFFFSTCRKIFKIKECIVVSLLPITRVHHYSAGSFNSGNHHQIRSVQIHGVDRVVTRVSPIDLLLSPIIRNAFWIYTWTIETILLRF